jgi:hypothetical protein
MAPAARPRTLEPARSLCRSPWPRPAIASVALEQRYVVGPSAVSCGDPPRPAVGRPGPGSGPSRPYRHAPPGSQDACLHARFLWVARPRWSPLATAHLGKDESEMKVPSCRFPLLFGDSTPLGWRRRVRRVRFQPSQRHRRSLIRRPHWPPGCATATRLSASLGGAGWLRSISHTISSTSARWH